mgnify:CR=1 FL=1
MTRGYVSTSYQLVALTRFCHPGFADSKVYILDDLFLLYGYVLTGFESSVGQALPFFYFLNIIGVSPLYTSREDVQCPLLLENIFARI